MPYWHYSTGMGWVGGLIMIVMMGLLLIGTFTVAFYALRRWQRPPRAEDEARRILDQRFARGEIDKDEYEQRRATLNG